MCECFPCMLKLSWHMHDVRAKTCHQRYVEMFVWHACHMHLFSTIRMVSLFTWGKAKSTLVGWFDCSSGTFASRDWPVAKPVFTVGYASALNIRLPLATGRPSLLPGYEPQLEEFASKLIHYRLARISVNVAVARHLIILMLVDSGQGDLIVLSLHGAVDPSNFACSKS